MAILYVSPGVGTSNWKLGQLEKAEGWYQAAAAYRRFTQAWKDADLELQSQVEAARKRLKVLKEKKDTE